ncbi:MAG TPA: electron transfer flavoprotein subunit alpha/FixB family protein, partial [Acidimicrobiales bacterium]|nr:electron transfer flavoprotein subunit alpha/FixB family protein [Acidimicrobiales bacterium]
MALNKIWVVVVRAGDKAAPVSLELLTKARELASTVEGITWGDAAGIADEVGAHGGTALHTVGDLGAALAGPAVAAAIAAKISGGDTPDAIFVPQTYDGRDIAGRLSSRVDRPVLTNVVGLEAQDGNLVSEHAIFGGT